MDPELEKATNIVFIGGTGRCGTNLTKEILMEHPQVGALPFESRFTVDPHGIIDCYNTIKFCWSPYITHSKVQELEHLLLNMQSRNFSSNIPAKVFKEVDEAASPPYSDWELEEWFPHYRQHVYDLLKKLKRLRYRGIWPGKKIFRSDDQMYFVPYKEMIEQIFRTFLRELINDFLLQNDETVFVDDNTWNMLFTRELKAILPEAKFIHLVRDPKDVIVSFTHQRWAPDSLDTAIEFYKSLMDKIIDVSKLIPDDSLLQIKLEDLVLESNEVSDVICDFCTIKRYSEPIKKDLSHSHTGRWIEELDKKDQEKIIRETKNFCKYFNYSPT